MSSSSSSWSGAAKAAFITPPPKKLGRESPGYRRIARSQLFAQQLAQAEARGALFDSPHRSAFRAYQRPGAPAAGAIDAAVARYIRGSANGTRGMRKQTMAISTLPKMVSTSGGFVIKHRECLGVIKSAADADILYHPVQSLGAANFATVGMRLYPTNPDAFPWLSTIATRFEQYRWRKVNVQFITATGDGTTVNLGQGNVMGYIEYNPTTANNPVVSRDFMNNYGAVACKPSQSFQMGVEARGNPFELKWTATAGTQDPRFSADGSLYLASEGVTASTPMGYLYIDYEIELHKPQVL